MARVAKVNPVNGHPVWHTAHVFSHSIDLYDFIDKTGYFYTIWRNNTTATGKWNVLKIAKSTGTKVWTYTNGFASSSQAPLALDLDSAGNLYTTGSFGGDLGPGNWRIIKLNGTTGSEIFKTHITTDSTKTDFYSWGLGVAVLNNKPCFFGELQINYEGVNSKVRTCFVRLNPATGQIEDKKWLGGKYQYQSKTIAIQPSASKETFVLKQFSNKLTVQAFDANNQLLWNTDLAVPNKVVLGKGLKLATNGDLLIMSVKASVLSRNPFYSPPDSVSIYRLDPNGNLLSAFSFDHTSTSIPFEIVPDAQSGLFVFYKNNSDEIFLKNLNNSGAGPNVSLGLDFDTVSFLPKIAVDYSPNNLMVFGRSSGTVKAIKVTKSNLAQQVASVIPKLHRVGYAQLLKNSEVLICGQGVSGEEIAVKYSTVNFDTVWTRVYPNNAEILKFLVSEDSNHIYTISSGVGNSVLRKIDVSNGASIWSHSLTGTPRDLTFNSENNKLRIVGTTEIAGEQNVWSETIDTGGAFLGGFNIPGFGNGQNSATCVASLPNGSIWAGGSIGDSILGKAGFLMELASSQLYFAQAADTACGQLISPSGNYIWNSTGIYSDTVFSANGVDTVFTIEATIQTTDTSVTQNGHMLSANLNNASYQWLDCDANYAIISGETAQTFTPQTNGSYAVEISKDGCTDTSACFKISGIGILETELLNSISIFPNPSHGIITIELNPLLTDVNVRLLSPTGQIIESSFYSGEKNIVLQLPAQAGIYLVEVSSEILGRKVYRVSRL